MSHDRFRASILELIRRTSTVLPRDVTEILRLRQSLELGGSAAEFALELVMANIGLAKSQSAPLCQDAGTISFYVRTPIGFDHLIQ